jgi:hypothetical protein
MFHRIVNCGIRGVMREEKRFLFAFKPDLDKIALL